MARVEALEQKQATVSVKQLADLEAENVRLKKEQERDAFRINFLIAQLEKAEAAARR